MRKSYIIKPRFQYKFIGAILFLAFLALAAIYASHLVFIWRFAEIGRELKMADGHPFFQFLAQQSRFLDRLFLITGGTVALILVVGGALLSHRIAGPLHRVESHIRQLIKTGELKEMKFRRKDDFPELAGVLNELIRHLRR